jgi:hypothetical protein
MRALCRFFEKRLRDLSDGLGLSRRDLVGEMLVQRLQVERLASGRVFDQPSDVAYWNPKPYHRLDVLPLISGGGEGFSHAAG